MSKYQIKKKRKETQNIRKRKKNTTYLIKYINLKKEKFYNKKKC